MFQIAFKILLLSEEGCEFLTCGHHLAIHFLPLKNWALIHDTFLGKPLHQPAAGHRATALVILSWSRGVSLFPHLLFLKEGHCKGEFYELGVKSVKVPQFNQEYYQCAVDKNSRANINPDKGIVELELQSSAACLLAEAAGIRVLDPFPAHPHSPIRFSPLLLLLPLSMCFG